MMRRAGVPFEVIDRVLLLDSNADQQIRKSDN